MPGPLKTKLMGRCILVLFAVSIVTMLAGWFAPTVPFAYFGIGVCIFALGLLLSLLRNVGIGGAVFFAFIGLVCLGAGLIPIPEIEKDYPKRADELVERSDMLKDKHPPYVPDMIEKRLRGSSCVCYFNKSASVIGIGLGEATGKENKLCANIYPTFGKAIEVARGFECDLLPSVDLIDGYKKHLDDRVLAALEEHVSSGSSIFPGGKQGLLVALLNEVMKRNDPGRDAAAAYLVAAIELGGGGPSVPNDVNARALRESKAFLGNAAMSTPMGFYTQTDSLRRIFRRDRFLAKSVGIDEGIGRFVPIAQALAARPDLLRAYQRFGMLNERVCNADVDLNLSDLLRHKNLFGNEAALREALFTSPEAVRARHNKGRLPGVAFWPAATSPETRLFARIYGSEQLPESSCMEDLIAALRTGRASLTPTPESGYYDYQLYALESLVMPERAQESQKLLLQANYKKRLREAFEAMLTKRRETHVKSLHWGATAGESAARMQWTPELSVEPCATNYLRTARAYRFIADALKSQLDRNELNRIRPTGYHVGLLDELNAASNRFYGLYLVVCSDIGMEPELETDELESLAISHGRPEADTSGCTVAKIAGLSATQRAARVALWAEAKDWLRDLSKQDFAQEDVRVIVPVLSNMKGDRVRYWSVIGTRLTKIKAYYAIPPRVTEMDTYEKNRYSPRQLLDEMRDGERYGWAEWRAKEYVIPVQVFAEVTLGPKPLTRGEFRAICDKCSTKKQVIAALQLSTQPGIRLLPWLMLGVVVASGLYAWRLRSRRVKHTGGARR